MSRRCWTCNAEHDLDQACGASPMARANRAAGGPGNEPADRTADLFDDPGPDPSPKIATMSAGHRSRCPGCWDEIEPGETITYTREGWMHEECALDD